jgi:RIO kinase 1
METIDVRRQDFNFEAASAQRSAVRRKVRFDDDEGGPALRRGRLTDLERAKLDEAREQDRDLNLPAGADRWSVWGQGELGPEPYPEWLVTEEGAADTRLGVVKTGKEADVHLLERAVPETGRVCLLAEKRYRASDHRLFHRDAGYLEGRRTRESRLDRAIEKRTALGLKVIGEQWALAEFRALCRFWEAGVPVPYPVQRLGTDLLLEFLGEEDGGAAPRLAQLRPEPHELHNLWDQLSEALSTMARLGFAHGDLSPYNLLVHQGRLVVIDVPQIVDVVVNPRGRELLLRDVANVSSWFAARGLESPEESERILGERLLADCGVG